MDIVIGFNTSYLTSKGEEVFKKNLIARKYLLG
jgi:hypothetical protein